MVGYAGGSKEDATYYNVAYGNTQHRESIHMEFDDAVAPYRTLVEIFFRQIDPTNPDGQFADKGFQYTTAVYYHSDEQKKIAEDYIAELNSSGKFSKPIATQVVPFTTFFEAEKDHQQYYKKNPFHYTMYKMGSGRAGYIKKTWKQEE